MKSLEAVPLTVTQIREAQTLRSFVDFNNKSESHLRQPIRQLNRITLTIDDVSEAQSLTISSSNEKLKHFDIVAITPGTLPVFNFLCKDSDVDIIAMDFSHRNPFPLNKKTVNSLHKIIFLIQLNQSM